MEQRKTAQEVRNHVATSPLLYDNAVSSINSMVLANVQRYMAKRIGVYTKDQLRTFLTNIGGNEAKLRDLSWYLYYRSQSYFRLIRFYADMFDLRCRKVVPQYNLSGQHDKTAMLRTYNETLDVLDRMNLQGNMNEIISHCLIEDVCYAITYYDETGMFFYILDPRWCRIDSRYYTGDFGFSINMSHWANIKFQEELEFLGDPLRSMYEEYVRTGKRWIHCPDEYAACFKFRKEDWQTVIPPFLAAFPSLANLEDLIDEQAIADAQQIFKLLYIPMKVLSGAKGPDEFEITPDLIVQYFNKMVEEALPDYTSAAIVPGDELKAIDFQDDAASDTNRVQQSYATLLNMTGGGAVINGDNITSTAAFNAFLKNESEFVLSPLIPQINGFANRFLSYHVRNAAKVDHFEVSIYTKEDLRKAMLESCQYGFSNKLAYNTLLGVAEKDTLAMNYLEEEVLGLHDIMKYPLASSFTTSNSGTGEVGAPEKDATELTPEGDRSRNQ